MNLNFTKMHGLGNDFIVFDGVTAPVALTPAQIKQLGNRHTGIGFDQLLIVAPASASTHDFTYLVFNPDGSQAENCGNGARCMVSFIHARKLSDKSELTLQLIDGNTLFCRTEPDGNITVDMGAPIFSPEAIPFIADAPALTYPLTLANGENLEVSVLSMTNPHAVLIVPDIDQAPVAQWGPLIESHANFPRRVNAGFMQIVNPGTIRLRVYERGTGETLACGTGACAAVVAGIRQGLLNNKVEVQLPCGSLHISWQGEKNDQGERLSVFKTGPAVTVFEGKVEI